MISEYSRENIRVGITLGDVNGIGPELVIKAFLDSRLQELFTPVLYGSAKALNFYRNILKYDKFAFQIIADPLQASPKKLCLVDCLPSFDRVEVGIPSTKAGNLAFVSLEKACSHLLEGKIDVLVTLPIDKATIQNANFKFPGHTEYLTEKFKRQESLMLMVHEYFRVTVVTGHISLRNVADAITPTKIMQKIQLLNETLKLDFSLNKPKIAVLGLNPHAGDNGVLGQEEIEIIEPVIRVANEEGMLVMGPYPADGFFTAGTYRKFNAVLAMYHDQGLIPFKLIAQKRGVNYTAGLPIIRTSPDHGVAYDIAGKNRADETSFRNALYLAIDLFRTRTENMLLHENALRPLAMAEALVTGEDSVLTDEGIEP